jgi:hypothetical protein
MIAANATTSQRREKWNVLMVHVLLELTGGWLSHLKKGVSELTAVRVGSRATVAA